VSVLRRSRSSFASRFAGLIALTVALGGLALVTGTRPAYASSAEYQFLSDINHSRASHGLRPLSMSSSLQSVARRWSQHMASGGCGGGASICHNPNLGSQVHGWQKIGENVGVGPDESSIQNAFMNSSHHRANILDPAYTLVGIGTATGKDGRLYVTQDFEKPMGSSSSSSSSSSSKKKSTHSSPTRSTKSTVTHRSSSASSSARPRSTVAAPAAPKPTASPFVTRLRTLNAKSGDATDPIGQAIAFHSAMGVLAT
jgi:uncharacterized protein YkwD